MDTSIPLHYLSLPHRRKGLITLIIYTNVRLLIVNPTMPISKLVSKTVNILPRTWYIWLYQKRVRSGSSAIFQSPDPGSQSQNRWLSAVSYSIIDLTGAFTPSWQTGKFFLRWCPFGNSARMLRLVTLGVRWQSEGDGPCMVFPERKRLRSGIICQLFPGIIRNRLFLMRVILPVHTNIQMLRHAGIISFNMETHKLWRMQLK